MSAAKTRPRPGRLALLLIVTTFALGSLLTALAASASTPRHGGTRAAANARYAGPPVALHVSRCPSPASKWSCDRQVIDLPAANYAYDLGLHNASAQPSLAPGLASVATTRTERGPPAQTLDGVHLRLGAEGGASRSISDILEPGGDLIGKAGTDATIRELSGGLPEAQSMFDQLSQGGTVVEQTPYLTRVELPDGGFVQLRTVMSRSSNTAATIDVNVPGVNITKLKFNP